METAKKASPFKIILIIILVLSIIANGVLFVLYYFETKETDEVLASYSEEYFHYNSLTVQGFKDKVAAGDDFIVIISRPNCGSCHAIYEEVMAETEKLGINNQIYFLNVVELHRDTAAWGAFKEEYKLEGTPTYARYSGGEQLSTVGWTPERGVNADDAVTWFLEQDDLLVISE